MSKTKRDNATREKVAKTGVVRSLVTAVLVGGVRASAGRSGAAGMAGAFVFERVLRRSPLGALAIGAAIMAHDLYRSGRKAKDKRQAHHTQELGMASPPPEPSDPPEPFAAPPPRKVGRPALASAPPRP